MAKLDIERVLRVRADAELMRVHAVEEALLLRQACVAFLSTSEALRDLSWCAPDPAAWSRRARDEIAWARADGYEVSACLLASVHRTRMRGLDARSLALQALALDPGCEARFLCAAAALGEGEVDAARAQLEALLAEDLTPEFATSTRELSRLVARADESAERSST